MSGLTMGLLSLDSTTLVTLIDGGTAREKKYAKRILPVVKRHHLLLVTLLLSNSAAVEAMPIFLDRISNPIFAIVISVTAVLIFGEVIPQAICTRHGLAIGAYLSPLVYLLMGIFFIISFPLSILLDCCLGKEHGTFFRRAQLKALIDIHGEDSQAEGLGAREDTLSHDEVAIIKGCLDMKNKTARDAMLNVDKAFMINSHARLDHETMTHLIQRCHSRVPVYTNDRSNVVALLLTKTLIKLNPDDAIPISRLIGDERYSRAALFIESDMPLFDLLNLFQTGRSHLAIVREKKKNVENHEEIDHAESAPLLVNIEDNTNTRTDEHHVPEGTVIGIITLEDVIEELLQEEIEDEKDIVQEISQKLQFSLAKRRKSMISDDEDDTHPNIDTPSLFRWRHQARVDRMEEQKKKKEKLETEKQTHQQRLAEMRRKVKEAEEVSAASADFQKLKIELSELEKQEENYRKKEEDLKKEERMTPLNIDTICKEGKSKTIINKAPPAPKELSEEEKLEKQQVFTKKYKNEIRQYGMLQKWDDSKQFLTDNNHLVCEETANYLVIWCIDLEVEEKHELMKHVSHQCIVMQFILELAKSLKTDPRSCVGAFFARIKLGEKQYTDAFNDELEAFRSRIQERARIRIEEAMKEYEEEERKKRLGPGGLDPVEVMESLPKALQACFESQDIALLQKTVAEMPQEEAAYHIKRCIDSGLWVPGQDDKNKDGDEPSGTAESTEEEVYEKVD
ncbi:unnamed protein product [Lymnaea stagnalis]|uniref:CNNM transmembrane domain-containing protein n=1 Tax=Lymnaea stagnalis TaxID=6523 RepID=A0AAV2IJL3_LYMST